jgi:transposase
VHGVDEAGHVIVKRRLRRAQVITYFASLPPCLIGMEACATAHFWARELRSLGHKVRLMPPQYVKAYVKRGKNDAADAAAICEAVTRPSMRFVPVKSEEQQSALTMHRVRELLVRQRTQLINAVRGHLAEFGLVGAQGPWNVPLLLASMQEDRRVPELARQVLQLLAAQLDEVGQRIAEVDARIMAWHKTNPVSRRLVTIPGIGPLIATAIAATVPDPDVFRGGREFAACFIGGRVQAQVEHTVETMLMQRICGIALGYEDLVDHDELRHDPVLATLVGKLEARRKDCAPLAGKSTLNRLEHAPLAPNRYHKIGHDGAAIKGLFHR